jgi:hypothetical protein
MKAKSCETSNGSENSLNPKLSRPPPELQLNEHRGDVMMSAKAARINLMKNLSLRAHRVSDLIHFFHDGKMCKERHLSREEASRGFVCSAEKDKSAERNKSSHNQPEATRRSSLRR